MSGETGGRQDKSWCWAPPAAAGGYCSSARLTPGAGFERHLVPLSNNHLRHCALKKLGLLLSEQPLLAAALCGGQVVLSRSVMYVGDLERLPGFTELLDLLHAAQCMGFELLPPLRNMPRCS